MLKHTKQVEICRIKQEYKISNTTTEQQKWEAIGKSRDTSRGIVSVSFSRYLCFSWFGQFVQMAIFELPLTACGLSGPADLHNTFPVH